MSVWMSSLGVGAELVLELASSPAKLGWLSILVGVLPGSLDRSHWRNVPKKASRPDM